jgi:hypothetical protein
LAQAHRCGFEFFAVFIGRSGARFWHFGSPE